MSCTILIWLLGTTLIGSLFLMIFCYILIQYLLYFSHSIKLYTTFWSLSLYDLYVPVTRYEEEVGKLEQAIKALDDSSDMVRFSVIYPNRAVSVF